MQLAKDKGTTHAMTIDVEDYFHVSALAEVIPPEDWESQPSRVEKNTQRLLDLFDSHEVKSTFFVLGWVAERFPALVREIAQRGHEVASHGYSHQLIYNQTPDTFRQETQRSKDILEAIVQQPVEGYRAASYSITSRSLWALDILSEIGFKWDSSIFPVYHDNYGIPDTPSVPYLIKTSCGTQLIEYPITTANMFGLNLPAAGGGYFRQFPYAVFRYLFRRASESNSIPKLFYLHPWEIDPEQPQFSNASWLSRFRHYTNLDKCEDRLVRLMQDFDFGTISDSIRQYQHQETYANLNEALVKLA